MATPKKDPKKDNVTRNLVIGMIALVVLVTVGVSFSSNKAKENVATPASVDKAEDRKSTRLNSSHIPLSRMPSSA